MSEQNKVQDKVQDNVREPTYGPKDKIDVLVAVEYPKEQVKGVLLMPSAYIPYRVDADCIDFSRVPQPR